MRLCATLVAVASVCILVFPFNANAQQEADDNTDPRVLLREASALLPQIEKVRQPSALAGIAGKQVAAGDYEGALATYRANAKRGDNGSAVDIVAGMLASHGNLPLALDLVREADPQYRPNAYDFVSIQLAMEKHFDDALAAAHMIPGDYPSVFVTALMWINDAQWKAGDRQGAHSSLNEALNVIERQEERARGASDPNVGNSVPAMYLTLARRLTYAGEREDALATVERFYAFVNTIDDSSQKQLDQSVLASTQAIVGQFDAALDTARQLPAKYLRDTAIKTIVDEKSLHGHAAMALQDANLVEGDGLRNYSLRSVADGLASSGEYEKALTVIDMMQEPGERANGLAELALQQAKSRNSKARLTLQLASDAAFNDGDGTKPVVFQHLAVARGILGDLSGAEELISRLQDSDKVDPLSDLTMWLAGAGRTAEAISLAESQSGALPRVYALLGTATVLIVRPRAHQ